MMKAEGCNMSNVVIWSGGADSTWVLDHYAGVSSEDFPIRAVSIVAHPNLNKEFLKAQSIAQKNYLVLAKKRGYHIEHEKVSVRGNLKWGNPPDSFIHASGQPVMWLSALIQAVGDGDRALLGYIRGDCFWHIRDKFEGAFNAMCALKGVKAELSYPVEYQHKAGVLRKLKEAKIPDRCWFSCDQTTDGRPCNKCSKCDDIKNAKMDWQYRHETRPVEDGGKR